MRAVIRYLLAAVAAAAVACIALSGPEGLEARCEARDDPQTRVVFTALNPSSTGVDQASAGCRSRDVRILWSGVLWAGTDGVARVGVFSAGRVTLMIDGSAVLTVRGEEGAREAWSDVSLSPGAHVVAIDYERLGRADHFRMEWQTHGSVRAVPIPASAFSPVSLPASARAARQWSTRALWIVTACWLAALTWAAVWGIRRWLAEPGDLDFASKASLAACVVLFAAGMWWGWPGASWPPDELHSGLVIDAWRHRFSQGWFDKYPPVHFYLLTLAYAPTLVAEFFGRATIVPGPVGDLLDLVGRAVSVLLSAGTVTVVGLLSTRLGYRRFAWLAMLLAGAILPMAFYAKTTNVDAPYLFFFTLSMLCLARAMRSGRHADYAALGVFAALAAATKDRAYALYLLPGFYLAVRAGVGRAATTRPVHILVAALVCVTTWALAQNVIFNLDGVREHVRAILGPASVDYRVFASDLRGHAQLLRAVAGQLVDCFGWAGLAAVAIGVGRARRLGVPAIPVWFWLIGLSYLVTFAAVVGFSYDRFLLPLTTIFAIPAAIGIGSLLEGRAAWQSPLGTVLLVWILLRPVALNALMITDARYEAEQWMQREISPTHLIGAFGQTVYLPRLQGFRWVDVRPGIDATLALSPDFILVNMEFTRRFADDPTRMAWLRWLESGTGPYREVFRHKTPLPWYLTLALDARFRDRVEDPFTNLDKINPEIAVFRKIPETK